MAKKIKIISLLILMIMPGYAESSRKVAVVTKVVNKVEVRRVEEWTRIKVKDFLYEEDTIRTGKGAVAVVSFVTGIEITLKENTELKLKLTGIEKKGMETSLELFKGELFNRVRKLSSLEIRAPQAVVAVRGTEFGIEVTDVTYVYVLEGIVDVFNDQGRVQLSEGMETTVLVGKPPEEPKEMDKEEKKEKEKESEIKDYLKLTIEDELIAGEPVEMELSAIDKKGKRNKKVEEKILIESSKEMQFSLDAKKWENLPQKIKLIKGKNNFYLKAIDRGSLILTCSTKKLSPVVVEMNFVLPREKELIIDIEDDDKKIHQLRLLFERED